MESGENSTNRQISRRRFLKVAAGVGAAAVTGGLAKLLLDQQSKPSTPEPISSPELLDDTATEFGFNTHIYTHEVPGENHTIEMFKQNVDQLAANNQEWIRFNLRDWEVIGSADSDSIEWNEKMAVYDEAINYAKEKGLKIFFVVGGPAFAKEMDRNTYRKTIESFYRQLATRYKGKIDIWQIFNEADIHNFRNYEFSLDYQRNEEYLGELADMISAANSAIKEVDPNTLTTANISRWVGHKTDLLEKGDFFFDRVSDVDVLSLDLYPDDDMNEISRLPEYVEHFRNRYHKPVFVAELGLPTSGRFTEDDQAKYIRASIDSLKGGRMKPMGLLLYELTDETTAQPQHENTFGFEHSDGTPKKAFDTVLEAMQKDKPTLVNQINH